MTHPRRVRIIGPGRAGGSFALALASVGWDVVDVLGSAHNPSAAAGGVDLVLIATPDAAIGTVASAIAPVPGTVIAHAAGSLGLDVLVPHARVAALHPLMSLSNPQLGAERLLDQGWFAVAGDEMAQQVVGDLGGQWFAVTDHHRAVYHAAACVASPHLVTLLGQVARLATSIGIPPEAFWALSQGSLQNVRALGPQQALTGPAARGDRATIDRHLAALPEQERELYAFMVTEAEKLASMGHNAADEIPGNSSPSGDA